MVPRSTTDNLETDTKVTNRNHDISEEILSSARWCDPEMYFIIEYYFNLILYLIAYNSHRVVSLYTRLIHRPGSGANLVMTRIIQNKIKPYYCVHRSDPVWGAWSQWNKWASSPFCVPPRNGWTLRALRQRSNERILQGSVATFVFSLVYWIVYMQFKSFL